MNSLSHRELQYLRRLSRRIGANLYQLKNTCTFTNATQIDQTVVHGSPRTPHQPGGILDISANDFELLISAGIISRAVRVPHSRGSYYAGLLFADLEHFTGAHGGND